MEQDVENKIKIIVGHYGCGKTEFSINYSLWRTEMGKRVLLADLDIINPYFRSREKQYLLQQKGITVISSSLNEGSNTDIPALSRQLLSIFGNPACESVVDVGGDPTGARVLSRFNKYILESPYEMWMVVNANRPENQTSMQVVRYIDGIQKSSRLKICALINNTHLIRETTTEDIKKGNELCCEVKQETGIPIRFTCVPGTLVGLLPGGLEGELFPMNIYMRPEWL